VVKRSDYDLHARCIHVIQHWGMKSADGGLGTRFGETIKRVDLWRRRKLPSGVCGGLRSTMRKRFWFILGAL